MIRLYLSRDKQKIAVKMSGANFMQIKDVLKEHYFKFETEFEYNDMIWVKKATECEACLEALLKIEPFDISEEIYECMVITPETEKFRIAYNPKIVGGEPIGNYQIEGIKQGVKQSRLYLAHKMGLGKTFILTGIINHLWYEKLVDRILIVAPTESVYNFRRELIRFNTFGLKEEDIYIANSKNRNPFQDSVKVALMTYRTFLMLSDDAYFKVFKKKSKKYKTACLPLDTWGTKRAIVLDEAHLIKNRGSRWTKALHMHKSFFRFRYLLSGTPYPKGIEDLYSQLKFLDDNIVSTDYYSWLNRVAKLGTRWSEYAIAGYKHDEIKKFLEEVSPWIVREFTEDNIELPDLDIRNVYTEISVKQKKLYRHYIKMTMEANKTKNGRLNVREMYMNFPRIMLALDNPCILKGKIDPQKEPEFYSMVDKWKFEDHSKLEVTTALLERFITDEGKKTILWSGHPMSIKQLGEYYKKYNPIIIHGEMEIPKDMSKEEYRDTLLEKFKKDKKHKLLIASYFMVARAVNIVEAPRAICFDRPWNFEIWDQMAKRNHRYGTTEEVLMRPIIMEHTLEEKLDKVLKQRQSLDKDLLKYDSLGKDQWESIFEGRELD